MRKRVRLREVPARLVEGLDLADVREEALDAPAAEELVEEDLEKMEFWS